MSAVSEHEKAVRATQEARDSLSSLNILIATGDRGVSGADLMEAEADVKIAERLEAGALARAQEEQTTALVAAKQAAIDALIAGYESTSSSLGEAIDTALASLSELLAAAHTHQSTTQSGLAAAGLVGGAVPGYGRLQVPDPVQVIVAVQTMAAQTFGMASGVSHPHRLIEPITPFLPVGVG